MLKANYLKIKHQPLLLGVLLLVILYGLYFLFKMKNLPDDSELFKTAVVYLNCLTPFLLSLIVAIQKRFEDQKPNCNSVLSMPKRTKWLLSFSLGTYSIWLTNVLIFNLIFLGFSRLPLTAYENLWISLAIMNLVWLPIVEYIGIIHGYLASIIIGAIATPFMIYYGTTVLGVGLWRVTPWVYSTKIYLVSSPELVLMVITILVITLFEQLLVNWRFNKFIGN